MTKTITDFLSKIMQARYSCYIDNEFKKIVVNK